jgi:hypothetical protein
MKMMAISNKDDDGSSSSEDTDVIVARLKEWNSNQPRRKMTAATATSK